MEQAVEFIHKDMGRSVQAESRNVPINFTLDEVNRYLSQFKTLDKENKGYITIPDIRRTLKVPNSAKSFLVVSQLAHISSR